MRIEWQKQYDPKNKFNVDPQNYHKFETYLNDLRIAWKKYYDFNNELDINPNDYFSEEEYNIAINAAKQKKDILHSSNEITLNEIEMKLREKWKTKYGSEGDCITNPYYCETEEEYLKTLQCEWKDKYDPYDNYSHIKHFEYTSYNEYLRKLQNIWINKYNPNNLVTKVNGFDYDDEEDYLYDLREAWKNLYDENDNYSSNPKDFINFENYLNSLRDEWKNKFNKYDLFSFINPIDYSNDDNYLIALRNICQTMFDENNEYDINAQNYENVNDYIKDLKKEWKLRYDIDNKFKDINPNDFFSDMEYKNAIQSSIYNELLFTVDSEEMSFTSGKDSCVIYLEIENRTNASINVKVIESFIVNSENEQRCRDSRLEGYEFEQGKILPKAKRKRGDIFYNSRAGNLSDGWIYYVEIYDKVNFKKYILTYKYRTEFFDWLISSFEVIELNGN